MCSDSGGSPVRRQIRGTQRLLAELRALDRAAGHRVVAKQAGLHVVRVGAAQHREVSLGIRATSPMMTLGSIVVFGSNNPIAEHVTWSVLARCCCC